MRSLPVLALLIIVVGVVVARARARTKRQRELVRLCLDVGVSFAVVDPFPDTLLLPFRLFGRGPDRGIETVVWDPRDDGAIRAFDYWFEEQDAEGIGVKTDVTCAVVPLPFSVPPLTVLTRGAPDPSREPLDGTQVRLELEAFNRRFDVWSVDARGPSPSWISG